MNRSMPGLLVPHQLPEFTQAHVHRVSDSIQSSHPLSSPSPPAPSPYKYKYIYFPDSSVGKESHCNSGDPGSIPGLGRSAGEGTGYSLQYSWASLVAQLVKNLPAMQETWVRSLGWQDPLRRERLPTLVFWPGEFHGLYSQWGCNKPDMTE